jgi:hypothetical protein
MWLVEIHVSYETYNNVYLNIEETYFVKTN